MTTGEKIKSFRTLKNMTQKSLGEMTGIGEATIRKYELGIRVPKPTQLRKIADALGIGDNLLIDTRLGTIVIEHMNDAYALFFALSDYIGITCIDGQNNDGTLDPKRMAFRYDDYVFNYNIAKWLTAKKALDEHIALKKKLEEQADFDEKVYDAELNKLQAECDTIKTTLKNSPYIYQPE